MYQLRHCRIKLKKDLDYGGYYVVLLPPKKWYPRRSLAQVHISKDALLKEATNPDFPYQLKEVLYHRYRKTLERKETENQKIAQLKKELNR